jgi:chaperonin GroES
MGFGQLLESLGVAINTVLNQIFDAAHRQNAGGGFISQGLRLRGGEVRIKPAEFLNVNVPGRVSDAIHELQFAGPSPVLFQLVEFLLGAAADITSVKDVMTGEAPSGQAMGATLALIEQGMQVFSTIYTRIYRAMRKEFRLLMRLNSRYLDPAVYAEFLDDEELFAELMGLPAPGSQPMGAMPGMEQMASGLIMPQKAAPLVLNAQGLEKLAQDFDLKNMDCAPGADPRSVTDMQRMMRAQYLAQFKGQPGIDNRWIQEQELQAANIADWPKAFLEGPSPLDELNAETAKEELRGIKLTNDLTEQQVTKTAKEADKTYQEAGKLAFERGIMEGSGGMAGEGGMGQPAIDPRESELAEREMGVKMREMDTRELEASYNYDIAKKKLDVDADTSNRELAIKEQDSAAVRQREDKFDETLNVVLSAIGSMAQGVDAVVRGQQQVTAIMLAPRVLIRDPVTGAPVAAKPDLSGEV